MTAFEECTEESKADMYFLLLCFSVLRKKLVDVDQCRWTVDHNKSIVFYEINFADEEQEQEIRQEIAEQKVKEQEKLQEQLEEFI